MPKKISLIRKTLEFFFLYNWIGLRAWSKIFYFKLEFWQIEILVDQLFFGVRIHSSISKKVIYILGGMRMLSDDM